MKSYVNDVKLANGDETILHGSTSFEAPIGGYDAEVFYGMRHLDFVIELDHTALLEMIEQASNAKNKKFSNGPIAIRVVNIKNVDPNKANAEIPD
jgi:hypothetical protein